MCRASARIGLLVPTMTGRRGVSPSHRTTRKQGRCKPHVHSSSAGFPPGGHGGLTPHHPTQIGQAPAFTGLRQSTSPRPRLGRGSPLSEGTRGSARTRDSWPMDTWDRVPSPQCSAEYLPHVTSDKPSHSHFPRFPIFRVSRVLRVCTVPTQSQPREDATAPTCVRLHVAIQSGLHGEALPALVALVRFLPGVDPHVPGGGRSRVRALPPWAHTDQQRPGFRCATALANSSHGHYRLNRFGPTEPGSFALDTTTPHANPKDHVRPAKPVEAGLTVSKACSRASRREWPQQERRQRGTARRGGRHAAAAPRGLGVGQTDDAPAGPGSTRSEGWQGPPQRHTRQTPLRTRGWARGRPGSAGSTPPWAARSLGPVPGLCRVSALLPSP